MCVFESHSMLLIKKGGAPGVESRLLQFQFGCPLSSVLSSWRGKITWLSSHHSYERTMTSRIYTWAWALFDRGSVTRPLTRPHPGVVPVVSVPCPWCVAVMMTGLAWDGAWEWCQWQDRVSERFTVVSEHHPKVNFQTCNGTRHEARPMRAPCRLDGPMRAD